MVQEFIDRELAAIQLLRIEDLELVNVDWTMKGLLDQLLLLERLVKTGFFVILVLSPLVLRGWRSGVQLYTVHINT